MINVIFNDFSYELLPKRKEIFEKYTKIIQWGRANPTRFIEDFFKIQLTDMQKYVLLSSWCPANCVWLMGRNSRKATSLSTKTYGKISDRGVAIEEKSVGELRIGDKIYDNTGKLTEVIHLNPIIFEEVYEVEFEDGDIIECNADHLWYVKDSGFDKRNKYDTKWVTRSTDFIYNNFNKVKRGRKAEKGWNDYRFFVPMNKPIEYPKMLRLPVAPYILGLWLGDGYSASPAICGARKDLKEIESYVKKLCRTTYYEEKNEKKDCDILYIDREKELRLQDNILPTNVKKMSLLQKLRNMDLYDNKHIPEEYLHASINDRVELLQGLMDTDGHCEKNTGYCSFTQANYGFCLQFQKLLSSLGIKSTLTEKKMKYIKKDGNLSRSWTVYFMASKEMPCFKLKRKYNLLKDTLSDRQKQKAIVDVRKTGRKAPMRCITVSNESGLFLCGNKYTVTHNSFLAAPFMMARALLLPNTNTYIMAPSGGQSQETFQKMEDMAKGNIASLLGTSSVFLDECVRANTQADPFVHPKSGYTVSLYNGSTINTLNSVIKNIVGIRSSFSVYDEAGEMILPILLELLERPQSFINYNVICKNKRERLKIIKIG